MSDTSPWVELEKKRYAPYETVNVTATVKNKSWTEKSVLIQLYYEGWPKGDPLHFSPKNFTTKVGFIGALQTVTVEGSFPMPNYDVLVTLVTSVDVDLEWVTDGTDVKIAEVNVYAPPVSECEDGDFYQLSENPGPNAAMVCVNGKYVRNENYPNCYVEIVCETGQTRVKDGVAYVCKNNTWMLDETVEPPDDEDPGDEDIVQPPPGWCENGQTKEVGGVAYTCENNKWVEDSNNDDLINKIMMYTAIGMSGLLALTIALPGKKNKKKTK